MSVYVDDAQNEFGRMKMCHMLADTTDELLAMADRLGVARKWIQFPGTYREHFDIAMSKRRLALQHGAQPVTTEFLVDFRNAKRGVVSTFSVRAEGDAK